MNTSNYLVAALVSFDLLVLILLYRQLRSHVHVDRRVLFPAAAGLIGFVVHAFLFFTGAFLFVQLATIASIFGMYLSWSLRRRKEEP